MARRSPAQQSHYYYVVRRTCYGEGYEGAGGTLVYQTRGMRGSLDDDAGKCQGFPPCRASAKRLFYLSDRYCFFRLFRAQNKPLTMIQSRRSWHYRRCFWSPFVYRRGSSSSVHQSQLSCQTIHDSLRPHQRQVQL